MLYIEAVTSLSLSHLCEVTKLFKQPVSIRYGLKLVSAKSSIVITLYIEDNRSSLHYEITH